MGIQCSTLDWIRYRQARHFLFCAWRAKGDFSVPLLLATWRGSLFQEQLKTASIRTLFNSHMEITFVPQLSCFFPLSSFECRLLLIVLNRKTPASVLKWTYWLQDHILSPMRIFYQAFRKQIKPGKLPIHQIHLYANIQDLIWAGLFGLKQMTEKKIIFIIVSN